MASAENFTRSHKIDIVQVTYNCSDPRKVYLTHQWINTEIIITKHAYINLTPSNSTFI